ncbi:MAG TPA: sigma-70 family RNA polymerase sigma factor [Acidobacteriaceae bacterium]|jgi:RNA polymerase sigma-70 factor (ECF subfamily)
MSHFHVCLDREISCLRRYARVLTQNTTLADDLVQEMLVRAKQHLWKPGTYLRAWLLTIVHNQNVNQIRLAIRDSSNVDLEACSQAFVTTTDPTVPRQLRELARALRGLPEGQRHILLVVGLEGVSYDQAAAVLYVPLGTVRLRVLRGREALHQLLNMEDAKAPNRNRPRR